MAVHLSGQVVHYNQAACWFLKGNNHIQVEDHKLILPESDQSKFSEHLYKTEEIFRYKQKQLSSLKDIHFSISNSDLKFTLSLLASEKEMSFFGIRPLVMMSFDEVQIRSIDKEEPYKYYLNHEHLKQTFNLTKRERELCELFINGMNLEKAASHMGLTRSSIRTYLRNIFSKTPCNSQAELMKLLLSICR